MGFSCVRVVALMAVAAVGQVSGLCEYWGTQVDCDYDGDHKIPERCKGLGRRYCDRAPEAKECPPACLPQSCKNNWKTTYRFHENHFEFAWEDLVLAGDYDFVFTLGDQVCVQTCWKQPWKMTCEKTRTYGRVKYCTHVNCEHDDENRIVGCHKMFPWHKPTCAECAKLFPEACGDVLEPYVHDKYVMIDGEWKAVAAMDPSPDYLDLHIYDDPSDKAEQEGKDDDDDDDDSGKSDEVGNRWGAGAGNPGTTWTTPTEDSGPAVTTFVKKARDDESDSSDSDDDSDKSSAESSGSSKSDDDSDTGNSWLKEFYKQWCGDDDSCPLRINGGDSPMEIADSLNVVPVVWEDGEQIISFNEISFQLESPAEQVDSDIVTEAVADLSGVSAFQVQIVGVEPQMNLLRNMNGTLTAGMNIAMVTAVIWSIDPYDIDDRLVMLEDTGRMFDAMVEAGITNYLDFSMNLNVISAPLQKVLAVYPDAALFAEQADSSSIELSDGSGLGLGAIIGIIIGIGAVLLIGIALGIAVVTKRTGSGAPPPGKAEAEAKVSPTKLPAETVPEVDGCL